MNRSVPQIRADLRVQYYHARAGLIWSSSGNVRTVAEAEAAAPMLVEMALTERDEDHSAMWLDQLGDLVRAVREAKTQSAEPMARAA